MTTPCYAGIDIAKAKLDVGIRARYLKEFPNTPSGFRRVIAYLRKQDISHVGIESTGIYSEGIADALVAAGFVVFLTQPSRVKAFGISQGIMAKTDKIDSRVIAHFCEKTDNLRPYTPASAEDRSRRALVARRDQLVEDQVREKNRLEACQDAAMQADIRASIQQLKVKIREQDRKILFAIRSDERLARKNKRLQSELGVGVQTAAVLLTHLPELGHVDRQAIAALAGMAPFNRDSGNTEKKRKIIGGRERIRTALFLAARNGVRWKGYLQDLYAKHKKRGKLEKVALIACGRKLLIRLNTVMREFEAEEEQASPCA